MIYVANDVGSREFASGIRRRVAAKVEVLEMDAGDFAFRGNGPSGKVFVGIERKAIGDMISSMRSDRYAGFQMVKMNRDYDVCYLLIEGLWRPSSEGLLEVPVRRKGRTEWVPYRLSLSTKLKVHSGSYAYAELDKHICSIENKKNVILVRSTCKIETVWQVINRYQWWQKGWDEHESADPIKLQAEISFQHISDCTKLACGLPGVGLKTARRIASIFGSFDLVAAADTIELQEVEGVGPSLAAKLHAYIRSKK